MLFYRYVIIRGRPTPRPEGGGAGVVCSTRTSRRGAVRRPSHFRFRVNYNNKITMSSDNNFTPILAQGNDPLPHHLLVYFFNFFTENNIHFQSVKNYLTSPRLL